MIEQSKFKYTSLQKKPKKHAETIEDKGENSSKFQTL